ncbi:MAG: hypothetical protein WCJ67_10995 [Thermoleophilia bacterium]
MSNAGLFLLGVAVTIPAAAGIAALIFAAMADGRENDRIQAQRQSGETPSP